MAFSVFINMKQCTKCKEVREESEFYRSKASKDGFTYVCKSCCLDYARLPHVLEKKKLRHRMQAPLLRDAAIKHYGGYKCACCGETEPKFLSIDHVNNDGGLCRRTRKYSLYKWLKKNNYPPGLQVLCMNCNWGKMMNKGKCPHVK